MRERGREREREMWHVWKERKRERVSLEDKVWPKKRVKTHKNWKQKMPHFFILKRIILLHKK